MKMILLNSRLLQSSAIAFLASAIAGATAANAATPNVTPSAVNGFNLLAPFLGLNSTAYGPQTLTDNLTQTIAVNNGATLAQQQLAISDNNILYATSNTVVGISGKFGIAANLAGGLPNQPAPSGGSIPGVQPVGGLGATLGAVYGQGVDAYAGGDTSVLPKTVGLLSSAAYFDLVDAVAAKNYFANGSDSAGTATAVAPPGFALPAYNGLPNTTNSVYNTAYGVSNTTPGQNPMGNSRPFQVSGLINAIDPSALPGLASSPAFPSGHTSFSYTESMLIGMMVPQLYQSMMVRASEYGDSRIVLGAHYALDVIGGRALAEHDLAEALANPLYQNNAAYTGTPIALQATFAPAATELNSYLAASCGATVANCAASQANPYAPSTANAATYAARLTYGLPTHSYAAAPHEQAPAGGPDASILLATLYGGSTAAALAIAPNGGIDGQLATSTINQIVVNTEGQALAAFYGTPLSYWSRVNLYAAAGYFQGVTGTLNTTDGDHVTTDVTVAVGGAIDVTGQFKVDGNFTVDAGGALGVTLGDVFSQVVVGGSAALEGALDVTLANGFSLASGDTFDIVGTGEGLTNGLTSFMLDGELCDALGGQRYKCYAGAYNDFLTLVTEPGALVPGGAAPQDLIVDVTVKAVPEPSTWALMLAGFVGLGFAGYRRATRSLV